jgi:CRP/FNR family transcriptional regulator, anaerobic regulatory protein
LWQEASASYPEGRVVRSRGAGRRSERELHGVPSLPDRNRPLRGCPSRRPAFASFPPPRVDTSIFPIGQGQPAGWPSARNEMTGLFTPKFSTTAVTAAKSAHRPMKKPTLKDAWSGHADCRQCSIRTSVLFAGLDERDFERIHSPIDQFALKHGAVLYRAGEEGSAMFTVRTGLIKLLQYLPDGSQRIVRLAHASDVIGLELMVEPRYHHDAVALQPTDVCRFPVDIVRQLSFDNPKLHQELMLRWHHALSEADAWLTELSTGPAKQRVARLLLRLADGKEGNKCELFSREDMGAMLGITTETASRTIAEFKRKALLNETTTNRFRLDLVHLRRIADS